MPKPLSVLILDDNPSDAELMAHELRRAGLDAVWTRVDTEVAFLAALDGAPDVILADYALPGFDALRALRHLRERQLDIPCLVVTGTLGDELAAECIKEGACDYLLKDRLGRLGGAVQSALEQQSLRAERRAAVEALHVRSEQLRALNSMLTLAEQRERRRVAGILHDDLQQLLVGARFRLAVLQRGSEEAVRRTATELEELINQSLEVTRSLTRELSPPVLHDGGLVPALEWLSLWMRQKHGLAVELIAPASDAREAEGLRILLFQAVQELLFNVVKHAQVKQASVAVDRPKGQIRVLVSDDGIGFDPARCHPTGKSGDGFGLFSIRERVEMAGGRMEIESQPGKGSRITLTVPQDVLVDEESLPILQPPGHAAQRRSLATAQRIRILLAEDHAIVREGLVQLLQAEQDFEVVGEASHGQQAVELATQLLPDVVVMDVRMPGLDGIEATRAIHALLPEVQVIGLSMAEESEQGRAMREAGAVNYVSKIGPSDVLIAAIRACRPGSTGVEPGT